MFSKPKYKICRRLGAGVYEKCQTQKFVASEEKHSKSSLGKKRKNLSDYALQLIEKQKIRFSYGITEKQFSNYVKDATLKKGTSSADDLYHKLESRLDNIIYRLGLSPTRSGARQMVSHGHFLVNNKKTTIPSFQIKIGDKIQVREGSKGKALFKEIETKLKGYNVPAWLRIDAKNMSAEVIGKPQNTESFFDIGTVLEYYSR